uniref:Uncharacterized protein n=1 Tax=Romanomermis culicivorax TaxID=13658 RepID=A0A915INV7_ROMCU
MPNYLRSVAQQGKNPELSDVMEQMQTLRQTECERISVAIAECDKQILPQKSTNLPTISGVDLFLLIFASYPFAISASYRLQYQLSYNSAGPSSQQITLPFYQADDVRILRSIHQREAFKKAVERPKQVLLCQKFQMTKLKIKNRTMRSRACAMVNNLITSQNEQAIKAAD